VPAPDIEPLFGTPDDARRLLDDPARLRQAIDDILAAFAAVGAPATWIFPDGIPQARAVLLLVLALPGSADLHQGEQPGLEEVEDLHFYQAALSSWRSLAVEAAPGLTWLGGPDGVLAFHRGNFGCTVNLSEDPVPVIGPVLLASEPVVDGLLLPQAAVWTSGLPGVDQAAQYTVYEGR
jgi:hypothetical protein